MYAPGHDDKIISVQRVPLHIGYPNNVADCSVSVFCFFVYNLFYYTHVLDAYVEFVDLGRAEARGWVGCYRW